MSPHEASSGSRWHEAAGAVTSANERPTRPKARLGALGPAVVALGLLAGAGCTPGAAQSPASAPSPAAAGGSGAATYLYVASQDDASVAVIDVASNRLVTTVDLKALGFSPTAKPHHTAVEPDGSFWYVSLIGENVVLKLDRENRIVGRAPFETPGMLGLDPASDLLYVGRSMAAVNPPQRVGVIDRRTMAIEEVDVFVPRPHALVVDPRSERFFTASMGEDRIAYAPVGVEEVDLFDVEGMPRAEGMPHVEGMHPMADGKHHMIVQLAVSPDGRRMVGGGQMSGELLIFDVTAAAPRLVESVHVGGQPWHPSFTPDGAELWIPNQTANTVTVLDTSTWSVVAVIRHPAIAEPHGSAVSPDGRTVYVSSHNLEGTYHPADGSARRPGTVVAIDRATREVVAVVEVGPYAAGMSIASSRPH